MKIADLNLGDKNDDLKSSKDRITMIKEVFNLVLRREPSSRELSFYKYGIQEKEEIVEKLIENKEHSELIEKAQEFPLMEERAKSAEHKILQQRQNIKDSEDEILFQKNLLEEKNREIAILRREIADPYNFTHSEALKYIKGLNESSRNNINTSTGEENSNHFSTVTPSYPVKRETFLDIVYRLIKAK